MITKKLFRIVNLERIELTPVELTLAMLLCQVNADPFNSASETKPVKVFLLLLSSLLILFMSQKAAPFIEEGIY